MAKKYKIAVIKLLMKNGKMSDYGTIHEEGAFNRPVSDLVKENFIDEATKSDIDEASKKEKEANKAVKEVVEDTTKATTTAVEDLLNPLKVKGETTAAK